MNNFNYKVVNSFRWSFVSLLVTNVVQYLKLFILCRLIPPQAFGVIAIAININFITVAILDASFSEAIIQDRNANREKLSSLYWINIIIGLITGLIVYFLAQQLATVTNTPKLADISTHLALFCLLVAIGAQFHALFRKALRFKAITIIEISATSISFLVSLILALLDYNVLALMYGLLSFQACRTLMLLFIGQKNNFFPYFTLKLSSIHPSLRFIGQRILTVIINRTSDRYDQFVIANLFAEKLLGFYNIAFRLVRQPMSKLTPLIIKTSYPVLSAIQTKSEVQKRMYLKLVSITMSINSPLLIGLLITAPILIPLALGPEWIPATGMVQLMCILSLFIPIGGLVRNVVLSHGKAQWPLYWNLFQSVFTISIITITAHLYEDIYALIIALILVKIITFFLSQLVLVEKVLGAIAIDFTFAALRPILLSIVMGCITFMMGKLSTNLPPGLRLFLMIFSGFVSYSLLCSLFHKEFIADFIKILKTKKKS